MWLSATDNCVLNFKCLVGVVAVGGGLALNRYKGISLHDTSGPAISTRDPKGDF